MRSFAAVLVLAGCAGSAPSASTSAVHGGGHPLPTAQRTLTGRVPGSYGGYRSLVKVTDAERSLRPGRHGALIRLDGIGVLRVACARHPRASFTLTRFAAGEGPPTVLHDTVRAAGRTSISGSIGSVSGLTGQLGMRIPAAGAGHAALEHWEVFGGGEAFQFVASISDLVAPTTRRCDLLAQATVVTHGDFYRYARGG